jgi:hypothetical protein
MAMEARNNRRKSACRCSKNRRIAMGLQTKLETGKNHDRKTTARRGRSNELTSRHSRMTIHRIKITGSTCFPFL